MTALREAAQQALEALEGKRFTACGWRTECDKAITALKAALAEPTRSQQMADAGFTPRDTRLQCDECGGQFTRQMLPIHKCAALAEPLVMQVRPSDFAKLIKGKETMTGIPAYWAEWPNKEAP